MSNELKTFSKQPDRLEKLGWCRTDTNGLYYNLRQQRHIYVWWSSNLARNEEEIKLLPDGKYEVVGWVFDDRENRFDSLQDAVKDLPPTLKNWTD
tara:strand:- start:8659 stop:8943 length:285 start_codon:yes stop_codon:yes gene_type:complete